MIVVRNTFTAKPGQAGKLAAQLKDATSAAGLKGVRVLTDLTGDFNTVVMEHEAENLSAFEATMKEYMSNGVIREKMKGYTDFWTTGSRQLLQIV
jgi:hypothetical protein